MTMPIASHARLRFGNFSFTKMHGAGNDFVVLDFRNDPSLAKRLSETGAPLCRALADRRTGVGCDQILTIELPRSADAVAGYRIWNSDGSSSQQCGNGARCIAAWLLRDGSAGTPDFILESPVGTHAVAAIGDERYEIAMGAAEFAPQAIPMHGFAHAQDDYAIEIQGQPLRFGAVSMGNPHAVTFVGPGEPRTLATTVGPLMEHHPRFPRRTNVEFAHVISPREIELVVWERGSGLTLACGTGACATVVAAILTGRAEEGTDVAVHLPGGTLTINVERGLSNVLMKGPALHVFDGELSPRRVSPRP